MDLLVSSVVLVFFTTFSYSADNRYDRYSGNVTSPESYGGRGSNNKNCTIVVKHCAAHEGSRVDGTCNNYKYPTRGSARGPYLRLLNPDYSNDKRDIRKDRNGRDLPSARRVRTALQTDGRVVDKHGFTVAAYHFLEFIHLDVSLLNGPMDYLVNRQYCCKPEGQLDPRCKPILVPSDDPYLRVTDIRCLNFSRAETFQDEGCINETNTPEQINFQTPVIDLSTIYGVDEIGQNAVRAFKHGLLKLEYRDFRHVPLANLSSNATNPLSVLSQLDPAIIANLTNLSQQMLNLAISNSSTTGNMTTPNSQNVFNKYPMLQNASYYDNQILGSYATYNSQNMVGVLSMLQNLAMLNPQMLKNLTMLNPEVIGNLSLLNQQMLGNLSKLKPEVLANLLKLNPQLLGNLAVLGNMTETNRSRRQATVPLSLPSTGGLNSAVLTPAMEEANEVTPILMNSLNMTNLNRSICLQNMNNETRCYVLGFPEAGNFNLRTTTFAIFFMREHNRLAKALHKLNPCWKDDRLFKVARQINIATASNIFMYELLPMILGRKNMQKYGLISDQVRHVTAYDEDAVPLVYAEFEIAVRFYHTMLDGRIKLYDEKYHYEREFSVSNTSYRQSLIEQDKNFEKINMGTFFQPAAKIDDIQDPEISEKYYGDLQRAADLPSLDIQRGRDLGVRGYNDYRHICGLKPANKFEDFADVMDHEKIESLKRLYVKIEDVDLLAGIMSENFIPGTFAGPTLFCIITKQLQLFRFADRFWFERGDQFHSLTLAQLHEIRKTNMARFACDNADAIKFIQPLAFENVGPHNQHVPCTHIPGLDITKWQDNSCFNDQPYHHHYVHHKDDLKSAFKESKSKESNVRTPNENDYKYINDAKQIHWSMNFDGENENIKHTNVDHAKHKEELQRNLNTSDVKHTDELFLHFRKTLPNMQWSIDKYKHEGAVYGPMNKDDKQDFFTLKHWGEENGKYRAEIYPPKHEDDGKYRGENYRYTKQDDGKYSDETDWPIKKISKPNSEWITRQMNYAIPQNYDSSVFPSTSHQRYQSHASAPFFQTYLPFT